MRGKILFGSLALSAFLIAGNQTPIKQTILAETQETSSISQEAIKKSSEVSSQADEGGSETSKMLDSASSVEEMASSEIQETIVTTTTIDKKSLIVTSDEHKDFELTNKVQPSLPIEKVEENYEFSASKNQTTEAFIQLIGEEAQAIAWHKDLYASVMIAQAILETGSGNSRLARPPYHNLFGIKGSYQGKQVSFKTQEDKGNGELYTIQSAFRQYPSFKESLEDYASLLKKGISGNASFYQGTWKSNAVTYQEAAKALTGKYATDTAYDKKLIALIEVYNLTSYDQNPVTSVEAKQEQSTDNLVLLEDSSEEKQTVEISNETTEQPIIVNETPQSVVMIPPTAQRPAKQLSGNQLVQ
ncbi:glucosaminidase domain-containing protein [Candidatus Enterococcus ferrettii]|uniref:Mannosyl-glycoprotein endo-beta-N-acetylglucosamidase-like domain-containing protein n=1 Tax=Candidatus Enterococcus ferrettii TaxID=2815324 RepID=A0ABV0ER48_9ENTE|nr:glucosaminidase domain-containing protein [Enterococcus sp. 665A]MBO1340258.1 glucosaminidase domain-containing protein [Enterococcus sp. 665A]